MGIITLENVEFFAYHGYYDEEQAVGNRYSVDIHVDVDFAEAARQDKLSATVNYEVLYKIIAQEMSKPTRLLEHIAQRIIDATYLQFPQIESIHVSVSKFNPPVGGVCGRSKVTLTQAKPL